jgi:hypothetical protein
MAEVGPGSDDAEQAAVTPPDTPAAPMQKLQLKNGDVIKSVNGQTVDEPSRALKMMSSLKTINLEVEHEDQPAQPPAQQQEPPADPQ